MKNIFFIIYDWALSGVNTFVENLIVELQSNPDINIEILYIPQFNYSVQKDLNIPMALKKHLKVFDLDPALRWDQRLNEVKSYLHKYENNIVISNYYYEFYDLAYEESINFVAIVHSDDLIYYAQIQKYSTYLSAVISVSNTIKKSVDMILAQKDKSHLISYGIDTKLFANSVTISKRDTINIIYAGRLEQKQKRVLDLIQIVKKLHEAKLDYTFHIVGSGSYEKKLQQELHEYNVVFYTQQTLTQMTAIYKKMDIILLTSEYEGLPLVLLEAMSMGVVPIVSDFKSGIEQLLNKDNSKIVQIGDIKGYVQHIKEFAFDKKTLYSFKKNAQSCIQSSYSSNIMAQKYEKVFNTIVNKQKLANKKYVFEYKEAQKLSFLNDYIQREEMILKFAKSLVVYGNGKAGQMVIQYLKRLHIKPKYIIDDMLTTSLSVKYDDFLSLQNEVELLVMGKYQNIYHDLNKLNIPSITLESIR